MTVTTHRIANQLAANLGAAFNGCKLGRDGVFTLSAESPTTAHIRRQVEKAGGQVVNFWTEYLPFTNRVFATVRFTVATVCPACDRGGINMHFDCPDAGAQDHNADCPLCAGRGVYTVNRVCSVCEGSGER